MNPQEFYNSLAEIIEKAAGGFEELTEARQNAIYKRIMSLLNNPKYKLDLTDTGLIRPTGANLRKVEQIVRLLKPYLLPEQYKKAVENFSGTYGAIEAHNAKYFEGLAVKYSPKPIYKDVTKLATDRALTVVNPEGLREALEQPINTLLKSFVQQGGNWLEMTEKLGNELKGVKNADGDKVLRGYLENYHWQKRITRDSLYSFNRNYQQVVSADLGIIWYRYTGGLVEESRDCCRDRVKGYFTRKEIESWSKLSWQGKARGTDKTNIFELLGGYQCRHALVPVSERLVPKKWIDRAREKGYLD